MKFDEQFFLALLFNIMLYYMAELGHIGHRLIGSLSGPNLLYEPLRQTAHELILLICVQRCPKGNILALS